MTNHAELSSPVPGDQPPPPPLAARGRPGRSAARRSDTRSGYLFILPGIIGLSVFVIYPLLSAVYYALTEWNGATDPKFVGLANFRYLFTQDPTFWPSIRATALFVGLSVPSGLLLGLLLAVLVNRQLPGIRLWRTVLYLPVVLPAVATLTLWKFVYNPDFGLANQVLGALGVPGVVWLGDARFAVPALVVIGLWGVGASMVIFLAGLQAVPSELYEAAKLDGAGALALFWRITVPMMSPIIFLQLITGIIGALQAFTQPQLLTGGGPDQATNFLMYKIYTTAFGARQQFGLATAQAWVLFFLILVATVLVFRFSNTFVYAEEDE